jgi:hypothetical protein
VSARPDPGPNPGPRVEGANAPGKETMTEVMAVLVVTLLIAVLVIDRLAR